MKKKGISMLVLVITIITIIILAGVVIMTIFNNNPISTANESKFKSEIEAYNSDFNLNVSNIIIEEHNIDRQNINATTWDGDILNIAGTVKKYIPSMSPEDGLNYIIKNGKLLYSGDNIYKVQWASDLGIANSYIKDGLVVYFDGKNFKNLPKTTNWIDLSGKKYDGKPSNFSFTTTSGSNNIGGVVFDGIKDYVNTNTSYNFLSDFSNNEYTLEVDLIKGAYINSGEVLTYGESIIATSGSYPYFIWLTIKGSEVGINTFSQDAATFTLTTGANITVGGNYIIQVVVKKGSASKIFVNGILRSTFTADTSNITNIGYITLADLRINRNIRFSGTINFVRLYNRLLSDSEISKNYNDAKH